MRLKLRSGAQTGKLAAALAQLLVQDPLFCLYCPDPGRRQKFARAYFLYYLRRWSRLSRAYISADRTALAALTPRAALARLPHGIGALRLRLAAPGGLQRLRAHHAEIAELMEVVLPAGAPVYNLRIFAPPGSPAAVSVVQEAVGYARLKKLALTYETMSDRFVGDFLQNGFRLGYRHPVAGSAAMQTLLFADFSGTAGGK